MALLLAAAVHANEPDRRIAVTFDDLPWASLEPATPLPAEGSVPMDMLDHHKRLVDALRQSGVPAIGFVNESRLWSQGSFRPDRTAMLEAWLEAGLSLGNHTASHLDFNAVGLEAYQRDILLGEAHLRPLLAARGQTPQWFRHPYLRTGTNHDDRTALETFLREHGYRIAPVTVTNSDWIWAAAYRNTLRQGDEQTRQRLRQDYVRYMMLRVAYFERRSSMLLGYLVPQVLLLHANELNADAFAALGDALRGHGYRFVSLEDATRDPAYARPDGYTGSYGTSWIHRWAAAENRGTSFYGGEPTTPRWVLELAGVASE
ncbi:polysaccharide deacetylase family protein [Lysobacter niastensis]|uniref:Polysaccharide deacetylase family protein n=2 Tax=Lysobacter niastensis TaxID=380629 RepID=A0ABS0B4X3_9GAMM|nr:polysaccharide deacetylase family protein [Lysobacter niastensis]MBF6023648.1 polysaccharide deacetylase family protein [Lysobacter niastensis]